MCNDRHNAKLSDFARYQRTEQGSTCASMTSARYFPRGSRWNLKGRWTYTYREIDPSFSRSCLYAHGFKRDKRQGKCASDDMSRFCPCASIIFPRRRRYRRGNHYHGIIRTINADEIRFERIDDRTYCRLPGWEVKEFKFESFMWYTYCIPWEKSWVANMRFFRRTKRKYLIWKLLSYKFWKLKLLLCKTFFKGFYKLIKLF